MPSSPPTQRLCRAAVGLWAVATGGLAACGPALTDLGARVQVVPAVSPKDCRVIGEVDGRGTSRARAEVDLRNAAGQLRANRVVVGEALDNGGHLRLHGQAFGCRTAAP